MRNMPRMLFTFALLVAQCAAVSAENPEDGAVPHRAVKTMEKRDAHLKEKDTFSPARGRRQLAGSCEAGYYECSASKGGGCCPSGWTCTTTHCEKSIASSASDDKSCFAADTLVHSCTDDAVKQMKDVTVGEELKSISASGASECSKVFYVFRHAERDSSILEFAFANSSMTLQVSPWHLVFVARGGVGEDVHFARDRQSLPARSVQVGDAMFTIDGIVRVQSIEATSGSLVQVITDNSHVTTAQGLHVSTYSYHEGAYSLFAAPVKYLAKAFGYKIPETSLRTLDIHWMRYGHPTLVKALKTTA